MHDRCRGADDPTRRSLQDGRYAERSRAPILRARSALLSRAVRDAWRMKPITSNTAAPTVTTPVDASKDDDVAPNTGMRIDRPIRTPLMKPSAGWKEFMR